MKKIVSLFLSLMLASSLVACGSTAPVENVSQESGLPAIQSESVAVSSDSAKAVCLMSVVPQITARF